LRQFLVARVLGVGAQDEAAGGRAVGGGGEPVHARAQLLAQFRRADLLRDADVVVLRQEHQQPPGDADLGGQPRALGADGVLDHLHHQRLALEDQALDRHLLRAVAARRRAADVHVGHVQEGCALQADVDEGRLHARQHPRHAPGVDVADQAALERTLDVQLLHRAVLDDGHARFLRCPVDEDVLHGALPVQNFTPAWRRSWAVSKRGKPMIPE
jgi:hypothetical protein